MEIFQQGYELAYFRLIKTFVAFTNRNGVGNFRGPNRRNEHSGSLQRSKHVIGVAAEFVREAPTQCLLCIDDNSGYHRRPSLTISRTLSLHGLTLFRRACIPATISSCDSFDSVPVTGISKAAGTPCLVIVIFSPLATRSSKADKCVFASNAPIDSIKNCSTTSLNQFDR
jgi:hypothetical protein